MKTPSNEASSIQTSIEKQNKEKEEELRKRKGEVGKGEEWIEPGEGDDAAFEYSITKMRKNPLFILNPFPTSSQRKAQKTLRKSMCVCPISCVGLDYVASLCTQQRKIEKMVCEYELLQKEEK